MNELQGQLDVILNLSRYHREHEKYYAQVPLRNALALQQASRVLKALADRWRTVQAAVPHGGNRYMDCDDLNEPATIQEHGVLFMEGEGEPPEIARLKRDLSALADDFGETGQWLGQAMDASWQAALPLLQLPALAGVLGERHRIIVNVWQAANLASLTATVVRRALQIVERVDFAPPAARADLAEPRVFPEYLYAATELLDRAADITSESASLTHDNDRRWRVFRQRVQQVAEGSLAPDCAQEVQESAGVRVG